MPPVQSVPKTLFIAVLNASGHPAGMKLKSMKKLNVLSACATVATGPAARAATARTRRYMASSDVGCFC